MRAEARLSPSPTSNEFRAVRAVKAQLPHSRVETPRQGTPHTAIVPHQYPPAIVFRPLARAVARNSGIHVRTRGSVVIHGLRCQRHTHLGTRRVLNLNPTPESPKAFRFHRNSIFHTRVRIVASYSPSLYLALWKAFDSLEGKGSKRRAASVAGEGGDCSIIAAVGPRMSQSKIREERGGQEPSLRGPTPPSAVGRDSLVPGRPAGWPP
ncbi:hypothetical protein Sjap_012962 [Stephania japonica]|uniref:Uncharacterized protein n=1 Tax=Stephania japonica TaxID=461633 RepID=A0AAP0IY86_9MAGN